MNYTVIFVSDNNKIYSDFWEPQAKYLYTKFNIKSRLYYLTDNIDKKMFSSEFAEVVYIKLLENVPKIIQALFAKWYFPCLSNNDENVLIGDIDLFITSKKFINRLSSLEKDIVYHMEPYDNNTYVPGYFIYGQSKNLYKFFQIGNYSSFEDFCNSVLTSPNNFCKHIPMAYTWSYEASPDWRYFMAEERYAYYCLTNYSGKTDIIYKNIDHTRIDRVRNSEYDPLLLSQDYYVDFHCPRPYDKYKDVINDILDKV